mgnify:CR=1 FL=1
MQIGDNVASKNRLKKSENRHSKSIKKIKTPKGVREKSEGSSRKNLQKMQEKTTKRRLKKTKDKKREEQQKNKKQQ